MRNFFRCLFCYLCLSPFAGDIPAKEAPLFDRNHPVPADQPIPAADFVRPYLFEEPELNPSGTHFAAFTKNGAMDTGLMVAEIGAKNVQWIPYEVETFAWISDSQIVLNQRDKPFVIDVSGPHKRLSNLGVLSKAQRGLQRESGFLYESVRPSPPSTGTGYRRYWALRENGEPGFCVTGEAGKEQLYYYADKKWRKSNADLDEITPITPGNKPGEMIVLGPTAKGKTRAVHRLDAVSGALGEVIYQHPRYDCARSVSWSRGSREINGTWVLGNALMKVWFSERMNQVQNLLNRQFSGALAQVVSTDNKESRFLIEVKSDRQPPVIYFLDYDQKSLSLIDNTAPWIDPDRMLPLRAMSFTARDGAMIDAYLMLPANASKTHPVPLVVSLHAGPWQYRGFWAWNRRTQSHASRGYAVLEINYRGSQGYDSRFEPADRFDFLKMHHDVTDGVRQIAKSELIDPTRIAIEGVGFGSFLALCGAVYEQDLYRCAIVHGGIFDWKLAIKNAGRYDFTLKEWLPRHLGDEATGKARYEIPSPLADIDRLKVPVFITRNVTINDITYDSQVAELAKALKGRVPFVNFGEEIVTSFHDGYSEVMERTVKIEEFLAEHMPPNTSRK